MDIRAAFIGLIEVESSAQVDAYEAWHATDHLAENWALPTVVYAGRWIARPALRLARTGEAALERAQFLIAYFFRDPVDEAIDAFAELGGRLTESGRGFSERQVVFGRYFDLASAHVAAGHDISARALPHRRHAGALIGLDKGDSGGEPALLGTRGVLGCYRFVTRPGPALDALPRGELRADLYFCDAEPGTVWSTVAASGSPSRAGSLFSGAFATSR